MSENFATRHIGLDADALATMLGVIGVTSLDELAAKALPAAILDALGADGTAPGLETLPAPISEHQTLAELRVLADSNTVDVSMLGQGYYDTLTPPVLLRNVLENPAWYTAYTPYQPEISQGRLEAVLNFQTMIADLTGLDIANASMLDEGTAAAEAMTLMHRAVRGSAHRLAVDVDVFTQTAAVLATRAEPLGIEIVTADLRDGLPDGEFFGVIAQLPGASGRLTDWSAPTASPLSPGGCTVTPVAWRPVWPPPVSTWCTTISSTRYLHAYRGRPPRFRLPPRPWASTCGAPATITSRSRATRPPPQNRLPGFCRPSARTLPATSPDRKSPPAQPIS